METDELIWVNVNNNFCVAPGPSDGKQPRCIHHLLDKDGHRYCGGAKGRVDEFPCRNNPRILVNKKEYATWKLTR